MKKLILLFILILVFILPGCSDNTRIDRAEVVKCITAQDAWGKNIYTFHLLTDEKEPVSVEAVDYVQAMENVKKDYLPDLSLARLEIIIYEENFDKNTMFNDLTRIKRDYSVSPSVKLSLADKKTFAKIEENESNIDEYKEAIIRKENENEEVVSELLSVYNKNNNYSSLQIVMPLITSEGIVESKNIEIASK